ncbi:MAG: HAD family hydrolase [Candidatus Eremiobacteraeota bacterium]|nr:HAD family hydrolase [Candidatus Eremiobacteraeota bacterium]
MLRIGIDFDNTLVDYRPVLASAAHELSLLERHAAAHKSDAPFTKEEIRELLRSRPGGEADWQRLQAHVYGIAIARAPAFEGLDRFVREARRRGCALYVVSHKSRFAAAAPDGPDLREAAHAWLQTSGLAFDAVYFEPTREAKFERLASLQLTHFIDDLEEVLRDPAFPPAIRGIHFRDSWDAVFTDVFAG